MAQGTRFSPPSSFSNMVEIEAPKLHGGCMGTMGRQYWPLDEVKRWHRLTWNGYWEKTGANEPGPLDGGQADLTIIARERCTSV